MGRGIGWIVGLIVTLALAGGLLLWLTDAPPAVEAPASKTSAPTNDTTPAPAPPLPEPTPARSAEPMERPATPPLPAAPAGEIANDAPTPFTVDTLAVTGHVVDDHGLPVAGARIALHLSREARKRLGLIEHYFLGPVPWDAFPSVTTDVQGRFAVTAEEIADSEGHRRIRDNDTPTAIVVSHPGYRPLFVPLPGASWDVDLGELVLLPGAVVTGRVVDDFGSPLVGADVHIPVMGRLNNSPSGGWRIVRSLIRTTSGNDGRFRLDTNRAGEFLIEITLAGHRPARQRHTLHLDEPVDLGDIVLEIGGIISGQVVDTEDQPLPGVRIKLRPVEFLHDWGGEDTALRDLKLTTRSSSGAAEQESTTEETGRFVFDDLPESDFAILAALEGHDPRIFKRVSPGSDPLVIVLSPEALLVLTLVDDVSGQPIVGASAKVRRRSAATEDEQHVDMDPALDVLTGREAAERLGRDGSGPGLVVAGPAGYLRNEVTTDSTQHVKLSMDLPGVPAGEILERTLRLVRAASVAGQVVDDAGAPVADVAIKIEPDGEDDDDPDRDTLRSKTDGDGHYQAGPLSAGSWLLMASRRGYVATDPVAFELAASEARTGMDLALTTGARVTGVVYQSDGQLARNHPVTASPSDAEGDASEETRTDTDGRFLFDSLAAGEYVLRAYPGAEFSVRAGPEARDVVLQLRRLPTVRGRVLGADNRPVEADVDLTLEGSPWPDRETETNSRGDYVLQEVSPGSASLVARDGDSRTPPVTIDLAFDRDEIVDLAFAAGLIRGLVVEAGTTKPIAGVRVTARTSTLILDAKHDDLAGSAQSAEDGTFRIESLPAGSYHVLAEKTDYQAHQGHSVELGVDGRAEVTLELQPVSSDP